MPFTVFNNEFGCVHLSSRENERLKVWIFKCKFACFKWRWCTASYLSFDASSGPNDLQTRLTNGVSQEHSPTWPIWGTQNQRFEHQNHIRCVHFAYVSETYCFNGKLRIACRLIKIGIHKCENNLCEMQLYFVMGSMLSWSRFCILPHKNTYFKCKFCFPKQCIQTWPTLLPFCSKNNIWSSIICSTKCISCITFISQNRRKCDINYAFNFSIDKFGFCKSKRYFVFFACFEHNCVLLTTTRHYKIHYCVIKNSYQCQIYLRIWRNIFDNIKSKKYICWGMTAINQKMCFANS